jgi:hypothetical protein
VATRAKRRIAGIAGITGIHRHHQHQIIFAVAIAFRAAGRYYHANNMRDS